MIMISHYRHISHIPPCGNRSKALLKACPHITLVPEDYHHHARGAQFRILSQRQNSCNRQARQAGLVWPAVDYTIWTRHLIYIGGTVQQSIHQKYPKVLRPSTIQEPLATRAPILELSNHQNLRSFVPADFQRAGNLHHLFLARTMAYPATLWPGTVMMSDSLPTGDLKIQAKW